MVIRVPMKLDLPTKRLAAFKRKKHKPQSAHHIVDAIKQRPPENRDAFVINFLRQSDSNAQLVAAQSVTILGLCQAHQTKTFIAVNLAAHHDENVRRCFAFRFRHLSHQLTHKTRNKIRLIGKHDQDLYVRHYFDRSPPHHRDKHGNVVRSPV